MKTDLKTFFKKQIVIAIMCIIVTPFLSAQSTATEIETLLQSDTITYAQAARFVFNAAEVMSANDDAFNHALEQKWLPKKTAAEDKVRLDRLSLLIMRSFNMKGGIFYSMTKKSPHYAYRELVFLNVIQETHDPQMTVTGERLLFYITRILARDDDKAADEARKEKLREEREAAARRKALAAEITTLIVEQELADTKAEATSEGVRITLSNILFEADSADLPEAERAKIREIARILRNIQGIKLQVAGYTTRIGAEDYLMRLSEGRAKSVADYLVLLDAVEQQNVSIVGYGGSRTIGDVTTSEGLAANRRVEITVLE